jgi:hypothetical protein
MPTLTIENVPDEVMERLTRSAADRNVPVGAEVIRLLERGLSAPAPNGRPAAGDEAPTLTGRCDFPRPLAGPTVRAAVGGERLPARPVILEPTPE